MPRTAAGGERSRVPVPSTFFPMFRHLLKHASNYTLGNGLMILAGLVSFPILTRVLRVDEYGLMSLIATALLLLVGIGKLGMQHATLRFFSEVQAGKRAVGNDAFVSTVVYGMAAVGAVITLLWAALASGVPVSWWNVAVIRIDFHDNLNTMLARMVAGLIIYSALTLALDRDARQGVGIVRGKLGW